MLSEIVEPEAGDLRGLDERLPGGLERDVAVPLAGRGREHAIVGANGVLLPVPRRQYSQGLRVQGHVPHLRALRRRAADGEQRRRQVHVSPAQIEEFPAPQSGVDRLEYHGREHVGVRAKCQPFRIPALPVPSVRSLAFVPPLRVPGLERGPEPGFLGARERPHGRGAVDAQPLDARQWV